MNMQDQKDSQEMGKVMDESNEIQSPVEVDLEEGQNEEDDKFHYEDMTEGQLVEEAKELMKSNPETYASIRSQMDGIKRIFYKKVRTKNEELLNQFIEQGGVREDFKPQVNPLEEELREIMNTFKEKRSAEVLRADKERKDNLEAKNKIIEELKALLDSTEDFGKKIPQFQKLQQDWKSIGAVPPADSNTLWKNYQLCVENFYDSLKINNELREYDFRKNMELKTSLCEQAEKLADEKDILAAFKKLQDLHEEWREVGPVSKENRESIWNRFKEASTVINKRHHDYFDRLRTKELENLEKKKALCEKLESIDLTALSSHKEWQDKSDEILAVQEEWKSIGFAPKKDNVAIYERFRTACDSFFKAKNAYFKSTKEMLVANLNKKLALCEKAESLKESTEWRKTSDILVQLQKDWKSIGSVPKKQSDVVWNRFVAACDYFFDRKNKELSSQKNEQEENLSKKRAIIEKIKAFAVTKNVSESVAQLKAFVAEWNEVGHVPFKDKDKVYKAYKEALDAKFDQLDMDQASRKMDSFKSNLQDLAEMGQQKIMAERKKLLRQYEALNAEIATCENNIGFFSVSSKSASGLLKEMQQKIEKLKKEKDLVFEKIKMIEEAAK